MDQFCAKQKLWKIGLPWAKAFSILRCEKKFPAENDQRLLLGGGRHNALYLGEFWLKLEMESVSNAEILK